MMTSKIRVQPTEGKWVVRADGAVIGDSKRALELVEENCATVVYFPREDLAMAFLEPSEASMPDAAKGLARYFNIVTRSGLPTTPVGRVYGGGGTDSRYAAGATAHRFNGAQRLSVIAQANNINQQNFAAEDLAGVVAEGGGGRGGRGGSPGGGGPGGSGRPGGGDAGDPTHPSGPPSLGASGDDHRGRHRHPC